MSTYADVDALVLFVINGADNQSSRYTEEERRRWIGSAMLTLWRNRQDLFVGSWVPPSAYPQLSDTFPLPDTYLQSVADFTIGMSQAKDDDHVNEGRAAAFMAKFSQVSPL